MPNLKQREACAGCSACATACPYEAIAMRKDAEGFAFPVIDKARCIACGACERACVKRNADLHEPKAAYAFTASSEAVLCASASGGAFACVAQRWLAKGGVVFAVAECNDGPAAFCEVRSEDQLKACFGSKYYQAELKPSCIKLISQLANNGQKVLFAGTPCQVAAVSACVLAKARANVLLIDLVCQGAPSWKSVKTYRQEASCRQGSRLVRHRFRAKDERHSGQYVSELHFANGEIERFVGGQNLCSRAFMYNLFLRESCFRCEFACKKRIGDITLGDFWGYPYTGDFKAGSTSLVLCNTEAGEHMVAALREYGALMKADVGMAVDGNVPLRHSVKRPLSRSFSYALMGKAGYAKTVKLLAWKHPLKQLIHRKGGAS